MYRVLSNKWFILPILLLVAWFGITAFDYHERYSLVEKQLLETRAKNEKLTKENEEIAKIKPYYQSESYLERQARARLNYKSPDEDVVFVYEQEIIPQAPKVKYTAGQNLRAWIGYILNN